MRKNQDHFSLWEVHEKRSGLLSTLSMEEEDEEEIRFVKHFFL